MPCWLYTVLISHSCSYILSQHIPIVLSLGIIAHRVSEKSIPLCIQNKLIYVFLLCMKTKLYWRRMHACVSI
jgi:hypothetical protein